MSRPQKQKYSDISYCNENGLQVHTTPFNECKNFLYSVKQAEAKITTDIGILSLYLNSRYMFLSGYNEQRNNFDFVQKIIFQQIKSSSFNRVIFVSYCVGCTLLS